MGPISTETSPTLTEAINNAATSIETESQAAPAETTPVETAPTESTPVEAAPTEPVETPAPVYDANTQRAVDLFNALNDPQHASNVLEFLARQAGYELKAPQPAQTQQVKEPGIADLIAESLGEEYQFLAPKLGPAIEAALNRAINPLRQEIQQTKLSSEVDRAISDLSTENKDFKQLEPEIAKLMKTMQPAPGVSYKDYLSNLTHIARAKTGNRVPQTTATAVVQRIAQNAKEALPSPSAATENRIIRGPARPTLDEAIAAALNGQLFE